MTVPPSNHESSPSPGDGPPTASAEVEQLVFQCLEATDLQAAIEELRLARPDRIEEVAAALKILQEQGLLEPPETANSEEIPERLGPFRLLRQLGAGGMGVVYLAEQEDLHRQVAVKLIRPEHLFFPGSRERFRREVEAVARLQHASIAPVFTVGEDNSMPYFSMEYVDGPSLATLLQRLGDKPPATVTGSDVANAIVSDDSASRQPETSTRRSLLPQSWTETSVDFCVAVGDALQHAHERGVLHRDVKPSNILITSDGRTKLVDFGLARSEGALPMTATSSQIGSLPYLPPEQLDGEPNIPSVRQDVYALGVTLYELLSMRSPFLRESTTATRQAIQDGKPTSLRSQNGNVSWDLETVCMKAMAPDPAQRYAAMADFVRDLENVRAKRAIEAKRPSLWIRLRRWEQRHPTTTAVAAVAVLLTAAAAITLAWFESSARQESDRLTIAAERRATEAGEVSDFLVELFEFASPDKSLGKDLPVGLLLQQGADRIQTGLADQPEVTARLQATFGRVYSWLGETAKAASFFGLAAEKLEGLRGVNDHEAITCRLQEADNHIRLGNYTLVDALLKNVAERIAQRETRTPLLDNQLKRNQSSLAHVRGDAAKAEQLLNEVLVDCQTRPEDLQQLCKSQRMLAVFLQNEHRHVEAQARFEQAIVLCDQVYPEGHPARIDVSRSAAQTLAAVGEYESADAICSKALADTERVFGEDHPRTSTVLSSLASIHREAGRFDLAAKEMERVNTIIRRYRDASKNFYARSLNDLAINYHDLGRFEDARKLYLEALTVSREAFPGDHELTAGLLNNLAETLGQLGDQAGARKHMRESYEMTKRIDPKSRHLATTLNGLALIHIGDGTPARMAQAEQLLEQAIESARPWNSETWQLGRAHALRAYLNNQRGNGELAEQDGLRALELYNKVRRADHTNKALTIYNVAWAMLTQGKGLDVAEPYFKQSIAMYERMQQALTDKAFPLNHYGYALTNKRPSEAIAPLEEALAIRSRLLPKTGRWRLISGINLANAHIRLKNYAAAEPLLLEVHNVLCEMTKPGSAEIHASAQRMVGLYQRWQQPEKAAPYRALLKK
ncbi:MAG: serine/threonine protein kinase [Hyphomicrobiaceae bacterium]|jgi:serine/threonine protein kinase